MSSPDEPTSPQPAPAPEPAPQPAPSDVPPPPPVQGQYSGAPAYQPQPGQPYAPQQYGTQPYPAQAAPQYAPREPSAFSALFDMGFRRYATPLVAKFLYVIVMILAALTLVGGVISGIAMMGGGYYVGITGFSVLRGLLVILASIVASLVILATYRLVLEFFVTQFHAAGQIRTIAERDEK